MSTIQPKLSTNQICITHLLSIQLKAIYQQYEQGPITKFLEIHNIYTVRAKDQKLRVEDNSVSFKT
jgi:hypothetical protein